jgi:ankyrin repeat protein
VLIYGPCKKYLAYKKMRAIGLCNFVFLLGLIFSFYLFNSVKSSYSKVENAALIVAADGGDFESIRDLIEGNKANLNHVDEKYKRTALIYASFRGHEKIVEYLLAQKDILVNCKDHSTNTALHLATRRRHTGVVKLLISHKDIDVNPVDLEQKTPLIRASWSGFTEIVKLLLSHKDIQVNQVDVEKRTPLIYASLGHHDAIVKLLLERPEIDEKAIDDFEKNYKFYLQENEKKPSPQTTRKLDSKLKNESVKTAPETCKNNNMIPLIILFLILMVTGSGVLLFLRFKRNQMDRKQITCFEKSYN